MHPKIVKYTIGINARITVTVAKTDDEEFDWENAVKEAMEIIEAGGVFSGDDLELIDAEDC